MAEDSSTLSTNPDQVAAIYDNIGGARYEAAYGDNEEQRLALDWLLSKLKPSSKVLIIGSGTGRPEAARLADAGHDVTGLDLTETWISLARKNAPTAVFQQGDVRSFSAPPQSYDAVCSCYALFHMSRADIRQVIKNVHTWLKDGGLFLFAMIPADWDDSKMTWLDQEELVSSMPVADYLDCFRNVGFDVRRYTVSQYQPKDPSGFPEEHLYICAQV